MLPVIEKIGLYHLQGLLENVIVSVLPDTDAMSFKLHLMIVSFIIVAVYVAWQLSTSENTETQVLSAAPQSNARTLSIAHASWGLNCRHIRASGGDTAFAGEKPASKLVQDNVLSIVASLCNGKRSCKIPLEAATLGDDPAPECPNKELAVEYRCFSYDRPRIAKASSGSIILQCEEPSQ